MPKATRRPVAYVGIDPGVSGGIAVIQPGPVEWTTMPETELDLWNWLKVLRNFDVKAVIERVHAMPKQGVTSMFTFGRNYGACRMALAAIGASWIDVTPQDWQRAMDIPLRKKETPRERKMKLRAAAQQLFPALELWSQPKTQGKQMAVCDALLLSEYCRRKMS